MPASDRPWPDIADVLTRRTDPTLASERVRDFMAAVSRIEADATRSARSRAKEISEQYAASLRGLEATGELSDSVKRQLEKQTFSSIKQLGEMTDEFGDRLDELAREYRSPESKALGAQLVIYSVVSLVVFLMLLQLGAGPMGVILVLIGVGVVGAFKVQAERTRAPWD